jgi:hypothetical protein
VNKKAKKEQYKNEKSIALLQLTCYNESWDKFKEVKK